MYTVTREIGLDAGHRVPFHEFQCSNLHGHRYTVRATASASETVDYEGEPSDAGMVVDFGDLKDIMVTEVHDRFDHQFIFWEEDPLPKEPVGKGHTLGGMFQDLGVGVVYVPVVPTAEELARLWFYMIDRKLGNGLTLSRIEVDETPNNTASYDKSYSPPSRELEQWISNTFD